MSVETEHSVRSLLKRLKAQDDENTDLRAKLAQAEEERDKWHQTAVATVKAIITGANPKDAERILRRDYNALFTAATGKEDGDAD